MQYVPTADWQDDRRNHALLYSGIALGLIAGAAVTTYLWLQRSRGTLLDATPFERAEQLIAGCESKIEDIERAIGELKEATR